MEDYSNLSAIGKEFSHALADAQTVTVDPKLIAPMPGQPREYFDEETIAALADSFREIGQIQPGMIRLIEKDELGREYQLLDGECRQRAALLAGISYKALLLDIDDEAGEYVIAAVANFSRQSHTAMEVSNLIHRLHTKLGMPMIAVARSLCLPLNRVVRMHYLQGLDPRLQAALHPTVPKVKRLALNGALDIAEMCPFEEQYALGLRVIKKEISLGTLRDRITDMMAARGTPIPEAKVDPYLQRRYIEKRLQAINKQVAALQDIAKRTDPKVLEGFSADHEVLFLGGVERFVEGAIKLSKFFKGAVLERA